MIRLFLYGTLLDPARLASIAGEVVVIRPARLVGWRRVAVLHGRYPTLRRGGSVDGAVAEVTARGLRRLRAYEGPAYRLYSVRVRQGDRPVAARAWIARGGTNRDWKPYMEGPLR